MSATSKTISALDELFRDTAELTDAQARDLVKAYADAWDQVERELQDALADLLAKAEKGKITKAQAAKNVRLRKALQVLTDEVNRLAKTAGVRITKDLQAAVDLAGSRQEKIIRTMLPKGADVAPWSQVNDATVKAIVNRSTKRIESRLRRLPADQARAMKRELIRGIAAGSNPNDVARRIMRATQGRFEGGSARATRIARTEMLDAMRAGAGATDRANKAVLKEWEWVAALSSRTCQACIGMHGRRFPLDQSGPEGHPNCRCARVPVTLSWKDLGFDIEEPPSLVPNAEKWFRAQPESEQVRLLGRDNLNAYRSGKFPMSQWAEKKENPDWRPSWVPTQYKSKAA